MENQNEQGSAPQKESISDALKKYKTGEAGGDTQSVEMPVGVPAGVPQSNFSPDAMANAMSQETDPDLMTSHEIVELPSKGLFYPSKISQVSIEYMTSKDEDILTTPSLIDSGKALNILLKRKIKTTGINVDDLLEGDRNALVLFLRTSSYGANYTVNVPDPRTGVPFQTSVDLLKLQYKEIEEMPDVNGHFAVTLPMRKKKVLIRLLTHGEDTQIFKSAEALKDLYHQEFGEYSTMKLKAHIVAIGDKTDRDYISKFVDAMPALDAYTIRRKALDVSPDVDMKYEFMANDGYKFYANLSVGIDFFSPGT